MINISCYPISGGKVTGIVQKRSGINASISDIKKKPQNPILLFSIFPPKRGTIQLNRLLMNDESNDIAGIICKSAMIPFGFEPTFPIVAGIDPSLVKTGDKIEVNGNNGNIRLLNVKILDAVTTVLTNKGRILILRRSHKVGTYRGLWAGVSGHLEMDENPQKRALMEIQEETGICKNDVNIIGQQTTILTRMNVIMWRVHPFLAQVRNRDVKLDWEHLEYKWIFPEQIKYYRTVPNFRIVVGKFRDKIKANR